MKISLKRLFIIVFVFGTLETLTMCHKAEPFPEEEFDDRLSGGSQTAFVSTSGAFSNEFTGMSPNDSRVHGVGDGAFEHAFVTAPAPINSGLGPAFNNVSCISCHHNDGKGLPTAGDPQSSLLMRISQAGTDPHGGALAVPGYGTQLQDKAIFGKDPECKVNITYTPQTYYFPDGESYELMAPIYTLTNLYTPINVPYMLSPRLAPPVFGLGLLETIDESDILYYSDETDANHDGISGKPNYAWNPETQSMMLGRFGLKSNTATLVVQVAAAYNNDIGVTNRIFPKETIDGQTQMDNLNDDAELPDHILEAVKFYVQTLQVPARRNVNDPEVMRGKDIFMQAKCGSCHIPTFNTRVNVAFPEISNQRIHPYTDLLLHDMGAGLADNRPDFAATGSEWRTAPLWGLGLIEVVNYPAYYLHDGRARTITEAIMWHGGEADQSKTYFGNLSKPDRTALLKFLKSL